MKTLISQEYFRSELAGWAWRGLLALAVLGSQRVWHWAKRQQLFPASD